MAFGTKVSDVLYQPGVGANSFTASGSITGGQGVYLIADNTVCATSASSQVLLGVALYTKAHGKKVAVAGPCNIVTCKLSGGTVTSAGGLVGATLNGFLANNYSGNAHGIIVDSASAAEGEGKVLLL